MFIDGLRCCLAGRTTFGGVVGRDAGVGVGLRDGKYGGHILTVKSHREGNKHHVDRGEVCLVCLGAANKVIQDS